MADKKQDGVIILPAWPGGPSREWSNSPFAPGKGQGADLPGGPKYAGRFICDWCREPSAGIVWLGRKFHESPIAWVCESCLVKVPEEKVNGR